MKSFSFVRVALAVPFAVALLASSAMAQVKMGVGGPMTGSSAAFGSMLKNGAEQAAEDINAAGGILGQKIQLFIGDDASIRLFWARGHRAIE